MNQVCTFLNSNRFELLSDANMTNRLTCPMPLAFETKLSCYEGKIFENPTLYRNILVHSNICSHTRPDISFSVN